MKRGGGKDIGSNVKREKRVKVRREMMDAFAKPY